MAVCLETSWLALNYRIWLMGKWDDRILAFFSFDLAREFVPHVRQGQPRKLPRQFPSEIVPAEIFLIAHFLAFHVVKPGQGADGLERLSRFSNFALLLYCVVSIRLLVVYTERKLLKAFGWQGLSGARLIVSGLLVGADLVVMCL